MPSSRYWRYRILNEKERAEKRFRILFWLFFCAALLAALWIAILSPLFEIKKIRLAQDKILTPGDINALIESYKFSGLGRNLLTLPQKRLESDLGAVFPAIDNIEIKKDLPGNTLKINFEKRLELGIWCGNADCSYIDGKGVIFQTAPKSEGTLILKITDSSKAGASLGDNVLGADEINFIKIFNDEFNKIIQSKITEFRIKPTPNVNLEAVTGEGWSVYLDFFGEKPEILAANLATVLKEAVKNERPNLAYVDLRIPNRIFYKLR